MPHALVVLSALTLAAAAACTPGTSRAQAPSPTPAPAPAAAPPAAPAAGATQQVEITGTVAPESNDERRRSTASRITIGREELDRMGDTSLGDVLKRLPGVTLGGPPGRGGGGVRMRGMGGGYTQILVDGQRMAPGFSLESIAPEQIERIEIVRAPVAEFSTQAIAGTINVVMRADFKRKSNELRIGGGADGGRPQFGGTVTRNGQDGALGYNLTSTLVNSRGHSNSETRTLNVDPDGTPTLDQLQTSRSTDNRTGLFANARLNWRLGQGESLELQPFFNTFRTTTDSHFALDQRVGSDAPAYTLADAQGRSHWTMGRLMGNWQTTTGSGGRLTSRFGSTLSSSGSTTTRQESGGALGDMLQNKLTDARQRDLSLDFNGKFSQLLGDRHSASAGWDVSASRRNDTSTTLVDGQRDDNDINFGDELTARTLRTAAYAQDEWEWDKQLSFYVGARWEAITTRSQSGGGAGSNRRAVFTPLAHLVWKLPDAPKDQIRASLTRSYKAPTTAQLIGRRTVNALEPIGPNGDQGNTTTRPDRSGNPNLLPELAWGIELGYEHYLEAGGIVSANLFTRRISNVIRNLITLQNVDYASVPRWVSSPTNFGRADAAGLELEAKLRASDLWATDLPLNIRANATLLWSRVQGVPGPDNRLEGQPPYTLNIGGDMPLRGTPLSLGASLNHTPAFRVQQFDAQQLRQSAKNALDAYALWRFNADASARLSISNGLAQSYTSGTTNVLPSGATESADTRTRTTASINLRAELRF